MTADGEIIVIPRAYSLTGARNSRINRVIELQSASDRPRLVRDRSVREKMREWIAKAAQLAWLIDPDNRMVTIYRLGRDPEVQSSIELLVGQDPVAGFGLDLRFIWNPLGQ